MKEAWLAMRSVLGDLGTSRWTGVKPYHQKALLSSFEVPRIYVLLRSTADESGIAQEEGARRGAPTMPQYYPTAVRHCCNASRPKTK